MTFEFAPSWIVTNEGHDGGRGGHGSKFWASGSRTPTLSEWQNGWASIRSQK